MVSIAFDVLAGAAIGVAAAGYAVLRRRLVDRNVPRPVWRMACFDAGLVVVVVALIGPLDAGASRSFLLHSVQHVLLAMVAPPLLVLADPVTLLLQATRDPVRGRLRRAVAGRAAAMLLNPLVAFTLFAAGFAVLYLSPLYAASLRSDPVHVAVHFHLLAAGLLFATAVLGPPGVALAPHSARLLLVLGTIPAHAVVGLALIAMEHPLAQAVGPAPLFGWTMLTDQRAGAALMWVLGEIVAVALLGVVLVRWRAAEERAGRRHDRNVVVAELAPTPASRRAATPEPVPHEPMRYQ